jgi:glycosyltransferase involved in cell wall biosynthesis
VAPEEVPRYLAAADLLVAPFAPQNDPVRASHFKQYGMWWSPVKVFEYMAMGKPILASSAGVVAEYLTRAGVTVPPGDRVALARAATRLLDDPELAGALGKQARERFLSNYTWKHAAAATVEAWKESIADYSSDSATTNSGPDTAQRKAR